MLHVLMLNIEQSAETNKLMRNIFVRVRYFLAVMFVILRYQIIIIQSTGRCLVLGSSDHCGSFGWVCSKKRSCHLVWLNVPAERWYRLLPVQSGQESQLGGTQFWKWFAFSDLRLCAVLSCVYQNENIVNIFIFSANY